jgi:hypothetical protein
VTGPALEDEPLPLIPADTKLTDRQLLIHLLQHVEQMHEEQRRLWALLEEFGPLLNKWRNRRTVRPW